ncbi:MAG: HlyD family secretion protein [Pseudomonadales bacterium]|nr:HlyD family secretion protein [Pseudomonadales bacterium]MBO7004626.1 HlyD family secretion protein [Pseudomonadales bacterium]
MTQIDETRDKPLEDTIIEKASEENQDEALVRKLTLRIGIVCVVLFSWYIASDRLTPYSSQAKVRANIVPIAPQVAGFVTEVDVAMNQIVEKDQVLLRIDPDNYELAVRQAEADLEQAGQNVGATTADVSVAQASLVEARARLQSTEARSNRIIAIEDTGVATDAEVDRAKANLASAQARVVEAEARLERAKEALGAAGTENPAIVAAISRLEKAQLDLERSYLRAPDVGAVTNARIYKGYYANVGAPLMTFISADNVWIEGYFRENNIEHIDDGDEVEFVLDAMPGRVHRGTISSIGYGVGDNNNSSVGKLSTSEQATGWLRDPQRFPVIINVPREDTRGYLREGGQADVIVYAGGNFLLNGIAWVYIRIIAFLSYLY